MSNLTFKTTRIIGTRVLAHTTRGNSGLAFLFADGTEARTKPDDGWRYALPDAHFERVDVQVYFNTKGYVVGLRRMSDGCTSGRTTPAR